MLLAIDAGNSRIKWGVHDGQAWVDTGWVPTREAETLGDAARQWPANVPALVCNVAGTATAAHIADVLARTRLQTHWFSASPAACGVVNRYDTPEKLGADRWAALLGAAALYPGRSCLVVCAGTASTVDLLDASGEFRGGVILPGFDLMRTALAQNTAQLPLAQGVFQQIPRNTHDAIVSGCMQAQLGAIERMFSRLAGEPGALCLLTGGAAHRLAPHLDIPLRLTENLVLEGLVRFASVL